MALFRLQLTECIGRHQQRLSDRLHRASDEFAEAQGWTITRTTDVFGSGVRTYRDVRFDQLEVGRTVVTNGNARTSL
jgi:hypothetical protein